MRRETLEIVLGVDASQVGAKLDAAARKVSAVGQRMTSIGRSMTQNVTLPIVAAGGALLASADKMNQGMATIRAGTGATGAALEALGDDFRAVFQATPAGVNATAQAIADLNTRTGLTGPALQSLATDMLELGRITGEDTGALIERGTRAFGDWAISSDNAQAALNRMFVTSQATGPPVSQLLDMVTRYGAPLRQLGLSFEQSAALMGKFGKEGVNTELVMGGLRQGIARMAAAGVEDIPATFRELSDAIKAAGDDAEANRIAIETFGARAGPDMAAAIREGRFEIAELMEMLDGSDETIGTAADSTKTFGDRMAELGAKVMVAAEPLGQALLTAFENLQPYIERAIARIAEMVGWFARLSPTTQGVIIAILGAAAAAGPLLVAIGSVVSAVTNLVPVIKGLGIALKFLAANPIGLAITAIAALVAVGVYLYNNWDEIRPKVVAIWEAITSRARAIWDAVANWFVELWDSITNVFMTAWEYIVGFLRAEFELLKGIVTAGIQFITGDWAGAWETISSTVRSVFGPLVDWIEGKIDAVVGFFADMYEAVVGGSYVPDMMDGISQNFSRLNDEMVVPTQEATGKVKQAFEDMEKKSSSSVGNLIAKSGKLAGGIGGGGGGGMKAATGVSGLIGKATGGLGAFKDIAGGLSSFGLAIPGLQLPSAILSGIMNADKIWGGAKKLWGGIKKLKFWADGGIVTKPTLGVAGEAGPEAIIPLKDLKSGRNTQVQVYLDRDTIIDTVIRGAGDKLAVYGV